MSIEYIIKSYLFLPTSRQSDGLVQPIFGLGWTLNYEMFFYTIFFIIISFRFKNPVLTLISTCVLFPVLGWVLQSDIVAVNFWTSPFLIEFSLGAVLAVLRSRGIRLSSLPRTCILMACIFTWFTFPIFGFNNRFLCWGLLSFLICALFTLGPDVKASSRFQMLISSIGDYSYSIYLVHVFVLRVFTVIAVKLGFSISIPGLFGMLVVVLFLSIFFGRLSYRCIELPAISIARNIFGKKVAHANITRS